MFILGFDEMMAVLYNPLWLILALFLFLFGKTVYQVCLTPLLIPCRACIKRPCRL